jgi:hypothetical protein
MRGQPRVHNDGYDLEEIFETFVLMDTACRCNMKTISPWFLRKQIFTFMKFFSRAKIILWE